MNNKKYDLEDRTREFAIRVRKFLKKVKNCGILQEVRDRRYYMKPSEKRRRDRARAERNRRREELKRKRALERQERNR